MLTPVDVQAPVASVKQRVAGGPALGVLAAAALVAAAPVAARAAVDPLVGRGAVLLLELNVEVDRPAVGVGDALGFEKDHLQQPVDVLFRRQRDADLVELLVTLFAFEKGVLALLLGGDVAADREHAAVAGRAFADPQPAPVAEPLLERPIGVPVGVEARLRPRLGGFPLEVDRAGRGQGAGEFGEVGTRGHGFVGGGEEVARHGVAKCQPIVGVEQKDSFGDAVEHTAQPAVTRRLIVIGCQTVRHDCSVRGALTNRDTRAVVSSAPRDRPRAWTSCPPARLPIQYPT